MQNTAKDVGRAQRVVREFTQHIAAPADDLFVLLCPVREKAWLDGWDYTMVYSRSGGAEEGCVFTTQEGGHETVWVITRHDPEAREVHFARITARLAATTLAVRVVPGDRASEVHIRYTHTSLSEEGDAFLGAITEALFNDRMRFWEASMAHYLKTGSKLPRADFVAGHH